MKTLLKKLLVPVLSSRPVSALASRVIGNGIPVFMLHRITLEDDDNQGPVTPEHLRKCLDYLVDRDYNFISLEQLATSLASHEELPPRTVVFTMDDGYADQAEITAPIFIEYDCPVTIFVITGMLDQALWPWDAQISWITENTRQPALKVSLNGNQVNVSLGGVDGRRRAKRILQDILRETPADRVANAVDNLATAAGITLPEHAPEAYRPMNWDMARRLEKQEVRIAPHSVTHPILSQLDEPSMRQEITRSWETLQRELVDPLKIFCYPSGRDVDFGQREIDVLKQEGFACAVSTTPQLVNPNDNTPDAIYSLPRLPLPEDMDDFIQYCTWIEYAKKFRG